MFAGKIALVCASNQNRSLASHYALIKEHGYPEDRVFSYGTGNAVRLPGPSPERPNVYDFGVPYETMQNDLTAKDAALYERNGVLAMLQRNKAVKPAPERWQTTQQTFDIVVTFETRVFDAVVAHLSKRDSSTMKLVHVIGLHIKDNHADALQGAALTAQLLQKIGECEENWENELDRVFEEFRQTSGRPLVHAVLFQ